MTLVAAVACGDDESSGAAGAGGAAGDAAAEGSGGTSPDARDDRGASGAPNEDGAAGANGEAAADAQDAPDAATLPCLHDVCQEGGLLGSECNACARTICEMEPWCCVVTWDQRCVDLAVSLPDVCQCSPESRCNDLVDDDFDQRFDCDDPDCIAAGECTAGTAPTGDPCGENADCAANAGDPFCIDEPRYEWPGGYCSELCNLDPDDCAAGSHCVDIGLGAGRGVCHRSCQLDADDCRAGYECREEGAAGAECVPKFETCDNGVDDDLDGLIDCEEFDCVYDPACEEICDDGIDNNANGTVDCAEAVCVDMDACVDRVTAVCEGLPSAAPASCVALGGMFACDPVTGAGCHPGQSCDMSAIGFKCYGPPNEVEACGKCGSLRGGCVPGFSCLVINLNRCAKYCCTDAECGPNGSCNHAYVAKLMSAMDSPVGVCLER